MNPRTKASLLWGVTGALVFLVGLQAYRLVTGATVTLGATLGVAVLVGVVAGGSSYLVEGRAIGRKEQS